MALSWRACVGEASHLAPPHVVLDDDATQVTEGGVLTPMEIQYGPDVECLSLEASQVVDVYSRLVTNANVMFTNCRGS